MMCSYACPPGYQKTQWPAEQGATGQSVGGLWCNDDGFLELTRPEYPKICEQGAGGVYVRNELSSSAAVCRTDYPGNEAMTIPVATSPGGTYPLTNPDSATYYKWQGKATTAQYYVNNAGVAVEDACVWTSSKFPSSAGNWAPTNIGVGKSEAGETYISIFPNLPTSTAVLDFDIEIVGDISGTCWLKKGQYSGNNGCTVSFSLVGFRFVFVVVMMLTPLKIAGRHEGRRHRHDRLQEQLVSLSSDWLLQVAGCFPLSSSLSVRQKSLRATTWADLFWMPTPLFSKLSCIVSKKRSGRERAVDLSFF